MGNNGDIFSVILPSSSGQITILLGRDLANHMLSDHRPSELTLWFASTIISANANGIEEIKGSRIIIASTAALLAILLFLIANRIFRRQKKEEDINELRPRQEGCSEDLQDRCVAVDEPQRIDHIGFWERKLPLKEGELGSVELTGMQDTGFSLPRQLLTDELPFK
jgi:hypothetical protein